MALLVGVVEEEQEEVLAPVAGVVEEVVRLLLVLGRKKLNDVSRSNRQVKKERERLFTNQYVFFDNSER